MRSPLSVIIRCSTQTNQRAMNRLKISLFFSFVLVTTSFIYSSDGLEFGVCERNITRKVLIKNVSPPRYEKHDEIVKECCEGFMKIKSGQCLPVCHDLCRNSRCIGNNKCKCNEGYSPVNETLCSPKCDPECGEEMRCIAPNVCVCKKSQFRKVNNSCEPICAFGDDNSECLNSKCIEPNVCECFEGYRAVSESTCEPVCSNCEHGDCVGPEQCECHDGYAANYDKTSCEPICQPSCLNSVCVKPNFCECDENFERLNDLECVQVEVDDKLNCNALNCQNGKCVRGECLCPPLHELDDGKCKKMCNKTCENGKCWDEKCVCFDGYKLSENETRCDPVCAFEDDHDCIEGVCIAPQTCKCNDGYKFLDSRNCTCVASCDPTCINAVCTSDGCICHENFVPISGSECVRNCTEGFTAVGDDCIDTSEYTNMFDFDESENDNFTTVFGEDEDDDDEEEGSTTTSDYSTTALILKTPESPVEHNDDVIHKLETTTIEYDETINDEIESAEIRDLIPKYLVITILIITISLILIILCLYWTIYRNLNSKYSYNVCERESGTNCVYFCDFEERDSVKHVEHCL